MIKTMRWRMASLLLAICLVLPLLAAAPALAQSNLNVSYASTSTVVLTWSSVEYTDEYVVVKSPGSPNEQVIATVRGNGYRIRGLMPGTTHTFGLQHAFGLDTVSVFTMPKLKKPKTMPMIETCPKLPARVAVFGNQLGTQCQMVDAGGIGRLDLIKRGFIDAVDVWHNVPAGVEVCFRRSGSLVFLDAAYMPRMAMDLQSRQRDGMTCGAIDRAGTVALLAHPLKAQPPAPEAPTSDAAPATLTTFDAIPVSDCLIKLVETLFLRATPGGEITGLVWLNSEVPVYEISGHWYKIEFEGKLGYVSRFYRKVLRGGCG